MADPQAPFWRRKTMAQMTRAEWESLCDGCGRCCLNKLIDEDTNATVYTDVSCKLLDCQSCRCSDYAHRQAKVKESGCRRPAPTGWWRRARISPGGTRWCRGAPRRCTRPASRCADALRRAKPTCRTRSSRNTSSAGRASGPKARGGAPPNEKIRVRGKAVHNPLGEEDGSGAHG